MIKYNLVMQRFDNTKVERVKILLANKMCSFS